MKNTKNSSSARARKKTQPEESDLVILGGGTGSTIAAWTFAGEGKRVVVVDSKYIGGFCPNIACLPRRSLQVGHPFDKSRITGHPDLIHMLRRYRTRGRKSLDRRRLTRRGEKS